MAGTQEIIEEMLSVAPAGHRGVPDALARENLRSLTALLIESDSTAAQEYQHFLGIKHRHLDLSDLGPDATITTRVKTVFINDPVVGMARIDVDTFKGVVTLSGRVKSKEEEAKERTRRMSPYAVTGKVFAAAKPDALFMHCLPAHAGEEVTQDVLDSPRSIIFDQAESRLHMQKAILATLAKARRK